MPGKGTNMRNSLIHDFTRSFLNNHVSPNDIIIDATLGNGHDTLYLNSLGANVVAFDIQLEAINQAKNLLEGLKNIQIHHDSFVNMFSYNIPFKGVVFNLGYLPNGDKTITTLEKDTLFTIKELSKLLKEGMFILITAYPGHEEGMKESNALDHFIKSLPNDYLTYTLKIQNRNNAPYVIVIEK